MTTRAFSLIELLVVIGVMAIVIAIVVPTLASARVSARQTECRANLRSLGTAVGMYADERSGGRYPFIAADGSPPYIPYPRFSSLTAVLAEYISAPPAQRGDDGRFGYAAPWMCPLDRREGPRFGVSYDYKPSSIALTWPELHLSDAQRFDLVRGLIEHGAIAMVMGDSAAHLVGPYGVNRYLSDGSVVWVALTNFEDWE